MSLVGYFTLGGRFELPIYKENRFSRPAPYQARLSQLAHRILMTYFNYHALKEGGLQLVSPMHVGMDSLNSDD